MRAEFEGEPLGLAQQLGDNRFATLSASLLIGNISKEFITLTGQRFAQVVAYAVGLGVIFWLMGRALEFFDQLLLAIEGADLRLAAVSALLYLFFAVAAAWVGRLIVDRDKRRVLAEVEAKGREVMEMQRRVDETLDEAHRVRQEASLRRKGAVMEPTREGLPGGGSVLRRREHAGTH